jgi:hypothetical protein
MVSNDVEKAWSDVVRSVSRVSGREIRGAGEDPDDVELARSGAA